VLRSRKTTICIVGLNLGTLAILQNMSKIENDIMIVTSNNVEGKEKLKIVDIVPHIYLRYGNDERAFLITGKYYKLLSTFDSIEVRSLREVKVRENEVTIGENEIIRARLVISGDEMKRPPQYSDTNFLKEIVEGKYDNIIIKGVDIFKMIELYLLLKDRSNIKISEEARERICELPYVRDIEYQRCEDRCQMLSVDIVTDRPNVCSCPLALNKVDRGRVVRDFELLLRAFLFMFNKFSRSLNIDLAVSFNDCLIHVGEHMSDLRRKFRELTIYRSCVDHDGYRICSRVVCFEDLFLSSDVYCSSFNYLPLAEALFYSHVSELCRAPVPYVFSIYSMYSGLPMYTPEYSHALSTALLRLEKEFK